MKNLFVGDVFYGKSYVNMINKAIETNLHEGLMNSLVKLDNFGYKDVAAWFVFLNGETHGHRKDWLWKNYLLDNKTRIQEKLVSTTKNFYNNKRNEEGYLPYRLCFQIDPFETGNKFCCRFVGLFTLTGFYKKDLTSMEYTKFADEFCLKYINEYEYDEKIKKPLVNSNDKYKTPVSKMGFSEYALNILKSGNVNHAHELLEIGLNSDNESLINEIKQKLYELFKKDNSTETPLLNETAAPKETLSKNTKDLIFNKKIVAKEEIVLEVVTEYVKKHIDIKKQELKEIFNISNHAFNVIEDADVACAKPDYKSNYFYEEDKSIPLIDGDIFVWKQWSEPDLSLFFNKARALGLTIEIL